MSQALVEPGERHAFLVELLLEFHRRGAARLRDLPVDLVDRTGQLFLTGRELRARGIEARDICLGRIRPAYGRSTSSCSAIRWPARARRAWRVALVVLELLVLDRLETLALERGQPSLDLPEQRLDPFEILVEV